MTDIDVTKSTANGSPTPPTPPELFKAPFSFASPSPLVLESTAAGKSIVRAVVRIDVPFDDPAAQLSLGTPGQPGLFLATSQIRAGELGNYESLQCTTFAAATFLELFLAPGASTQGAGFVFWQEF